MISLSVTADEPKTEIIRIHHLEEGALLWLELDQVKRDLFDQRGATNGFVEILLVDRAKKYDSNEAEQRLAAHILQGIPPEDKGREDYMVGPSSAHGSERYLIEFGSEALFVTPHWEAHWKKHNTLKHPIVDVQRCKKIGETKLRGVQYDILSIQGRYHQGLKVPRELSDQVDWFEYKVKDAGNADPWKD